MRSLVTLLCSFLLISFTVCFSQSLPETDKRAIVRVETPEGRLGTGFLLSDSLLGFFIVTNKHILQSQKTHEYFDSVFVRKNKLSDDKKKVIATDERATLYLRYGGSKLFAEHPDSNVDLVIVPAGKIQVGDSTIVNPRNYTQWFFGFKMSMVANREDMTRLGIRDGTKVQVIGFSFPMPQKPQFHISRFGHVALFTSEKLTLRVERQRDDHRYMEAVTSEWLVIDITARPGDSGGPVFAIIPGSELVWLVGLVKGRTELEALCLAHPSYYIHELVELVKEKVPR